MQAALLALVSAGMWGVGDFSGGTAAKRSWSAQVVLVSQTCGWLIILILALASNTPLPSLGSILTMIVSGWIGLIGLVLLYRGLAEQPMGVAAPVTSLLAVTIPVVLGMILEGAPTPLRLAGMALGLVAVVVIARGPTGSAIKLSDLRLPFFAGICFGLSLFLLDQGIEDSIYWPLAILRTASVVTLFIVLAGRKQLHPPKLNAVPLMVVAGVFDAGGNLFFALSTATGRLDVASVLSGMYPAITVLMAWIFLREKLSRTQLYGIGLALIAIALITL